MPDRTDRIDVRWSRRRWLGSALLIGIGRTVHGQGADKPAADLRRDLAPVFARAKSAGLRGFQVSSTRHYVGVGDAKEQFRTQAIAICESLSKVYQRVFTEKGFPVEFPEQRLTVVTLKNRASYAAYLGQTPGKDVGGHYDLDSNQLVMFDFRGDPEEQPANAGRVNEFILVHEALHQLTYNTGLLDRKSDVPLAISEGLAMYGELWRHTNQRATLGVVNEDRLRVFVDSAEEEVSWFPIEELLTKDALFEGETAQIAYAQSWVLVHHLIKSSTGLPRFQAYLKTLHGRTDASHRVQDAKKHFGDLSVLNKALKKETSRDLSKLRR